MLLASGIASGAFDLLNCFANMPSAAITAALTASLGVMPVVRAVVRA